MDTNNAYVNGYKDGVKDFAEIVKKYYRHFDFKPHPASVEYYIDQKAKEILERVSNDN